MRKQLRQMREESGEWAARKAAMEAEVKRTWDERRESGRRENKAKVKCRQLVADLERAEKQRKEKEKRKVADAIEQAINWLDSIDRLEEACKIEEKMKELENMCKPKVMKMTLQQNTVRSVEVIAID